MPYPCTSQSGMRLLFHLSYVFSRASKALRLVSNGEGRGKASLGHAVALARRDVQGQHLVLVGGGHGGVAR